MVKIGFKAFGCLTVAVFFTGTAVLMAVTSVVPAPHVRPGIKQIIYPLAVENAKIQFNKTMSNIVRGQPKQSFIFSELEANAIFYQRTSSWKNAPIKEPYLTFYEDFIRIRMDISLKDALGLIVNKYQGFTWQKSLKNMTGAGGDASRVSVTIDVYILWNKGAPELRLKKAYVGVFPIPLRGMINSFLDEGFNNALRRDFKRLAQRGELRVREVKVKDKRIVIEFEALVTKQYEERAQQMEHTKDPDVFHLFERDGRRCRMACSPEDEAALEEYMKSVNSENTLSEKDESNAREILERVKKK